MDGAEVATHEASHDTLPFRLSDVEIKPQFVDVHPIIADIRQELTFQWKLLRTDWNQQYTLAVGSAILRSYSAHSTPTYSAEEMRKSLD